MDLVGRLKRAWPRLRWVLLPAAILHAAILRFISPPVSSDIMEYLLMAQSLTWVGRPYQSIAPLANLARTSFSPFIIWPVGYSVVLAQALRVLPDPIWASLAVDWFFIAVAFVAWFCVMETIELPVIARVMIWTAWAFAFDPFQHGGPADWQSFALLSAAIALITRALAREKPFVISATVAGLLVGAAAITRYAYWPLVPALPAALLFIAWKYRRASWREVTALSLGAFGGLAWIAAWHVMFTGHATGLSFAFSHGHNGFFPQHLARIYPFPAAAFGLEEAVAAFFPTPLRFLSVRVALGALSAALLFFYFRGLLRMLRTPVEMNGRETARRFAHGAGGLIVAGTLATLVAYTLRFPLDAINETAVQIKRYWLPTVAPITLLLGAKLAVRLLSSPRRGALTALLVAAGTLSAVSYGREISLQYRLQHHPHNFSLEAVRQFGRMVRDLKTQSRVVYLDATNIAHWGEACANANGVPFAQFPSRGGSLSTTVPVTLVIGAARDRANQRIADIGFLCRSCPLREIGKSRFDTIRYFAMDLPAGSYPARQP